METTKILVTGPFSSGKTELIRSLSEIDVVSTSSVLPSGVISLALDFGRLTIDDENILYLFGTPGARRLSAEVLDFFEKISVGFLGIVIMVDSAQPATFREAKSIINTALQHSSVPYGVAANKQDKPNAWTHDDVRLLLRIPDDIPVVPCIALSRESAKDVFLELCDQALR